MDCARGNGWRIVVLAVALTVALGPTAASAAPAAWTAQGMEAGGSFAKWVWSQVLDLWGGERSPGGLTKAGSSPDPLGAPTLDSAENGSAVGTQAVPLDRPGRSGSSPDPLG